jgi:hypothetical protein
LHHHDAATELFEANKNYGIVPIVTENYGDQVGHCPLPYCHWAFPYLQTVQKAVFCMSCLDLKLKNSTSIPHPDSRSPMQGAASYYSVAVVPREFCTTGVTLASLAGKRSCHTGYRKTAGWTMPVGYLTGSGAVSVSVCHSRFLYEHHRV